MKVFSSTIVTAILTSLWWVVAICQFADQPPIRVPLTIILVFLSVSWIGVNIIEVVPAWRKENK